MDINYSTPRRVFKISAASSTLLSFAQFLVFYICVSFLYDSVAFVTLAPHIVNFLEGLFPIASALIIYLTDNSSIKSKILPTALIALPRLAYTFPYYYITYVTDVFNTEEALLISLIVSILYLIFFFLETFVCILILNYSVNRSKTSNSQKSKFNLFNFDDGMNFGILLSALFIFAFFFVRESIDTVSYFLEVGGGYYLTEILTIVISYLLLPVFAFIHYAICMLIKNRYQKSIEA